ncbi:unnamed protein product [Ixodes hexagonus]
MEAPRNRQYRATKLWNEVIHSFRGGMPRGKHRRHMRTYDDCFGASEAASWLHEYLSANQNFGPGVTRHQTLQLLQKFLESHIIEPVRSTKCPAIRDDKQLYRFVAHSPAKTPPSRTPPGGSRGTRGRTPLSSRENGPPTTPGRPKGFQLMADPDQEELGELMAGAALPNPGSPRQGSLGRWELHQLWESVTLARLRDVIGDVEDILDGYRVSGKDIVHNMDRLSRNGVVVLLDKSDDLPKWIMNAMKCLIHWPRATGSGSCLPNYPGFEADVLKVIADFFGGLGEALVPRELSRLFCCTFAMLLDDGVDVERPPSPDDSIENLLHSMSVLCRKPGNPPPEAPPRVKESVVRPIPLSRDLVYSTAFEMAEPVTRVESRQSVDHELFQSTDTASTISACSIARTVSPLQSDSDILLTQPGSQFDWRAASYPFGACWGGGLPPESLENRFEPVGAHRGIDSASSTRLGSENLARCSSAEELRDFARATAASCAPKQAVVRSTASLDPRGGFLTLRQIKRDQEQRREKCATSTDVPTECGGYVNLGFGSTGKLDDCRVEERQRDTLPRVVAATRLGSAVSFVSSSESGVACLRYTRNGSSCESLPARVGMAGQPARPLYASVTSLRGKSLLDWPSPVPEDSCEVQRVVKCLQVSSLLLPPRCRRHLHLLLRFIFKASRNDQLRLCPRRENMQALLDAFSCALPSAAGELTPEGARELLGFLVRHCDRIFAPPRELRQEVEARLAILRRGTGGSAEERRAECPAPSYCQQVSREQFEAQRQALSERALAELLDDILQNPRISDKERSLRVKQFQHNYPSIYGRKSHEVTAFRRNSRSRATVMGLLRSFRL